MQPNPHRVQMRICVIGAHKTGTSSVTTTLEKFLGVKWNPYPSQNLRFRNAEALRWVHNTRQTIIRDSPFNHGDTYKTLDTTYPHGKFILTIRPAESWYDSVLRWQEAHPEVRNVYNLLYDWDKASKEEVICKYLKRNEEIIEYFKDKPEKLLVINLWESSDTAALRKFIGADNPDFAHISFPHRNINPKKIYRGARK